MDSTGRLSKNFTEGADYISHLAFADETLLIGKVVQRIAGGMRTARPRGPVSEEEVLEHHAHRKGVCGPANDVAGGLHRRVGDAVVRR